MFEAVRGNQPLYDKATPSSKLKEVEATDSLLEPFSTNKALFNRATPNNVNRSANESFLEPNDENKPMFGEVDPLIGLAEEENQMIEPLDNRAFLRKDVSGQLDPEDV